MLPKLERRHPLWRRSRVLERASGSPSSTKGHAETRGLKARSGAKECRRQTFSGSDTSVRASVGKGEAPDPAEPSRLPLSPFASLSAFRQPLAHSQNPPPPQPPVQQHLQSPCGEDASPELLQARPEGAEMLDSSSRCLTRQENLPSRLGQPPRRTPVGRDGRLLTPSNRKSDSVGLVFPEPTGISVPSHRHRRGARRLPCLASWGGLLSEPNPFSEETSLRF